MRAALMHAKFVESQMPSIRCGAGDWRGGCALRCRSFMGSFHPDIDFVTELVFEKYDVLGEINLLVRLNLAEDNDDNGSNIHSGCLAKGFSPLVVK
ncbi:hypothetical protein AVEN_168638-1 [Araneus ventricosus]|uniref:Uncharacterized protein n=1 Tax=Araneus ventricosus TaxID=182803 RepID=A0A4Y2JBF7_ARAVE|nr:hypothetical protein AVEN_168638-1 [Araneus ventricosus]